VDLGAQQVKNIQEPIRAYQAVNETREPTPLVNTEDLPPLPDKPSIAVLPFQNMSGDPEQEYFADGIKTSRLIPAWAAKCCPRPIPVGHVGLDLEGEIFSLTANLK
jgi:hypothetical protein